MDRLLYISMTGAKQSMVAQSINSNNMANVSTPAFKQDLEQFRSMPVFGDGHPSRVFALTERAATDFNPGQINMTGRDLDVAVQGSGWIAVQGADGGEAYTRAGNMRISNAGLLVTGSGLPVLGNGGAPIAIPQSQKVEIGNDGTISALPIGQPNNALAIIDRIKLVNPEPGQLEKGEDGLVRQKNGDNAEPDASVQLVTGALETSNVSVVNSMVEMIELSRSYEMQVKMMKSAEENDSAVTQIMKMA